MEFALTIESHGYILMARMNKRTILKVGCSPGLVGLVVFWVLSAIKFLICAKKKKKVGCSYVSYLSVQYGVRENAFIAAPHLSI